MKRQVLNLTLLTALLTPVAMSTQIVSDDELDDISGGQLQVVTNGGGINSHQDNNNGSVILHHNVQSNTSGVYISNNADSAVNNATNLLNVWSAGTGPVTVTQTNDQCADNNVSRKQQEVVNGGDVNDTQDNENASVLITDNAQQNANNLSLVNSAVSAVSRATNMANIYAPNSPLTATQTSEQDADNEVAPTDLDYTDPDPYKGIAREGYQYIENGGDINGHQRNEQGSINITDNGQENIQNFDVTNVALSAANLGTNILNAEVDTATVTQSNTQNAANRLALGSTDQDYEFRQDVDTAGNINPGAVQENDNLSVALSGNAQRNAQAGILINGAASAINAGSNIANVNASGAVTVSQTNTQDACNWIQTDHPQDVNNGGIVYGKQYNNNGSIDIRDQAQSNIVAVMLQNAASSAVNIAQNIASISAGGPIVVTQTNTQTANNVVGATTTNPGCGITCP